MKKILIGAQTCSLLSGHLPPGTATMGHGLTLAYVSTRGRMQFAPCFCHADQGYGTLTYLRGERGTSAKSARRVRRFHVIGLGSPNRYPRCSGCGDACNDH